METKKIDGYHWCMIRIFMGGGGQWMGRGVACSERCLSGVVGSGGSLRDLSKNILEQGVGKGKSFRRGKGF